MGLFDCITAQFKNLGNEEYAYHYNMFHVRVIIETIEDHFGGKNWSWINGYDDKPFKEALDGRLAFNPDCGTDAKRAIRDAWNNDDLYTKVLARDPDTLHEIWESDHDSVPWFATLLQSAIKWSRPPDRVWNHLAVKKRSWSGYKDYSKSWTED